jgi:RNA-directed DNA polymerase
VGITESQVTTDTRLKRITWLSQQDATKTFGSLMHLVNEASLRDCFNQLNGKKAVGIDGMDKAAYQEKLGDNLRQLVERMKCMAYRPQPVRQILIPKEGQPGKSRPLGISSFEDKIVQKMMQKNTGKYL